MHARHLPFIAALALIACSAEAQLAAPGLWEHTFRPASPAWQLQMAMVQQQLAALPPDQRRQLEQIMAKNGVVQTSNGIVAKACLTPQQAATSADHLLPAGCTPEKIERNGSHMKVAFRCSKPQPMRGEADITFNGDKAYSGTSTTTFDIAGTSQQASMAVSGHWIGPDCGSVKPAPVRH